MFAVAAETGETGLRVMALDKPLALAMAAFFLCAAPISQHLRSAGSLGKPCAPTKNEHGGCGHWSSRGWIDWLRVTPWP